MNVTATLNAFISIVVRKEELSMKPSLFCKKPTNIFIHFFKVSIFLLSVSDWIQTFYSLFLIIYMSILPS